jgi:ureidoglycolate lyase
MEAVKVAPRSLKVIDLPVNPLEASAFAPFGQIIGPSKDGRPFGPEDAQLELSRGIPRFYIMSLRQREYRFQHITRHLNVTQCLASVGGKPWLLAVAPPNDPDDIAKMPDPMQIRAFKVPGTVAVKLHRSTWHIGPFCLEPNVDFFNLELADTNQVDHTSCHLDRDYGMEFRLVE